MSTTHFERYPLPSGSVRPGARVPGSRLAAVRRVAALAAVLFSLAACWGLPGESRSPGSEQALQSNLSVASAALAAGQPAVAQRLYLALAERFEDAPEPALGLGYVALRGNNPGEARDHFLRAASLADDAPGMKAEALLGAARASLSQGDSSTARRHLSAARDLARDPSSIAWIENGLAVAAVFEEDYVTAEAHYVSALRQPSAHPRIAANYVRMLIASARIDDAARTLADHAPSRWEENDRQALQGLIDEARRSQPAPDRLDPRLLLRLAGSEPSSAGMDERSGKGMRRATLGPRGASPGMVLLAGGRAFPLAGPGRTGGFDPVQADRLSPGPETRKGAEPLPTVRGTAPESQLPIRVPEPALERRPSLRTAGSEADRSATRVFSVPPASRDGLVLRVGPRTAASDAGSLLAPAADAAMGRGGIALLETGGHGLRLLTLAGSSHAPDRSGFAEPGAVTAPAPVRRASEAEAAPDAGSGSPVAKGKTWTHHLGPDPAQSANALVLAAASRNDSRPHLAHSELPSSPVSLGPRPGAASATHSVAMAATPETGPHADAAQPLQPRLQRAEGEVRLGLSEPASARAVNVAFSNENPDYDPFSAAPDTFRPILLASASPHLDDFLWHPDWMQPAGATHVRHRTMVAVDGADDPLALTAEAATGASAPGGEWSVLLGTGQRLSLEVAAAAVAVASPEIADVQLLSPRVLFVMGRNLGRTTISVLGEDGSLFERDVTVVLDLEPLRQLLAGEPGLQGVRVDGLARGVSLAGDVDSQEAADRALRLAAASLPEGVPVESNLDIGMDLSPLRALLAGEPGLAGVEVRRVGRGVALTGEVATAEAADRARRLAVASLPAGVTVENNLRVVFDVVPLRKVLAAEPDLEGVELKRLARGVALSGEVGTPEAADRAFRLATASLPDGLLVENNLNVELDLLPLRAALAGEPGLGRVHPRRLTRGVVLTGEVDTPEMADRAFRVATASLPEGILVESNLNVELDLSPLGALIAGEPGLEGVQVQPDGGGVALTGEVGSIEAADRAYRLAAASLPDGTPVENHLRLVFDVAPLRTALAEEPGLGRVNVQRLARSVVLSGDVDSPEAESRALRLAAASLPEDVPVESELDVGPDLESLRALFTGEPGLAGVELQRIGRSVALTGEVASAEAADRAHRLAVASLPESLVVENNLRVVFDIEPLVALLAKEPGLARVQVTRLARGVALAGDVDSPEAADRALRLSVVSLPEGLLVENHLDVELDLGPFRALLTGEPGLEKVEVKPVGRGVALTGEVGSAEAADRARRLAVASLPENVPVENNLRVALDVEPLRELLAREPGLDRVHVERLARGVALSGDAASPEAADRALRLAAASLPEGLPVENNLNVALDLESLQALMADGTGLRDVHVQRMGRGVALTGEVDSAESADRAADLVAASLLGVVPLENHLRVEFDAAPLRALLAQDPDFGRVRVQRLARGVALTGEVDSPEAADRAMRLATASLPAGAPVENSLRVLFDLEPLRAALAREPGLDRVQAQRLARGIALAGEVDSPGAADLALRLATASLPEGLLVEDNLNVGLDLEPIRALMADDTGLGNVQVQRLGRGVVLSGEVASADTADLAVRLALVSLPEDLPVENNLRVVFDIEPLRAALAGEPGLHRVQVRRLARGVALAGEVDSPEMADRAVRVARASLPEGLLVENNLGLKLDLVPLDALIADEPGMQDVNVQPDGLGVALAGKVAALEAAERAHRFAVASLPEGTPVANRLRIVFDVAPLRALLAGEPGLDRVQVARLARSVALSGEVDSPAAESRALGLAAAFLPEDIPVENDLKVGHDLDSLRALLAGETGLEGVDVKRVRRGVALTGEVASAEAADRARRLAAASLPETVLVENNLRVVLDMEPLRAALAGEPGLEQVLVRRLARGVALSGDVGSPAAADLALRLAAASLPEGVLVEDNLSVGLDLEPLRALMADEPGLRNLQVQRIGQGVLLTGVVPSAAASDRAHRLAAASLPESVPLEHNLRVVDLEPLRQLLAAEAGLQGVRAEGLERGVALVGEVASQAAVERALDLAGASLPDGMPVASGLRLVDLEPLRAVLAAEPGVQGVRAERRAQGVSLAGEVASQAAVARALDLAGASLPDGMPVASNLGLVDLEPLRAVLAAETGLQGVRAEGLAEGVSLAGEVASQAAVARALDLAAVSLPEGMPVENDLRLVDLEPLRTALAAETGLQGVRTERIERGVTLEGEVASQAAVERTLDLAAASLPDGMPVVSELRLVDLEPLRALMAAEAGLDRVHVQGSRRSVSLSGDVDSPELADRAIRLAAASLPEGIPVDDNLNVGLGLASLRAVLSDEAGLEGVRVQRVGRGVALTGEVAWAEAAERSYRLATASLPEGTPVANNLRVEFDIEPLREALAEEPGLEHVLVRRLARGVVLAGDADSPEAADRALRLAAASLPEGLLAENNLTVSLDLAPLRALLAREQGLEGVRVQRVGRGVVLTGEVAWAEAAERAHRLAAASLSEGVPVDNNLRVLFELAPLRTVLAGEPGLDRVRVRRLARGVALAGEVDSAADADRALRLAAASLPEGLLVENNLSIGLDLGPLRALLTGEPVAGEPGSQDLSPLSAFIAGQPGLEGVAVQRVGRGVALIGEVASAEAAERAYRLAVTSLPETVPVENNLRVLFDIEPVRAALAAAPGLEQVSVQRLARGVALSGPVDSPEAERRALRLAAASLPEGLLVENNLAVGLDLAPLRTFMAGEPGLAGVDVRRVGRSVAMTGEVGSAEAADRALGLAVASLPEGLPVENNLRVVFDIEPLRTLLAAEPGLDRVQAKRLARGVALAGDVDSPETADRALRLARASLPEGLLVEDNLSVVWDVEPTRALLAAEPGLEGVLVQRVGRGLALTGEVASAGAADRAHRLAAASLPEGLPVENNLRVVFDFAPLRAVLAGEPELARVQVQGLAGGVVLTGEVASEEAAERAQRIAAASLPEGVPVENSLRVLPDIEPLRLALAAEPGLERVQVQRLARGIALSGEVDSPVAEDRALRFAAASLPEGVPVENNLNVGLDLGPLRSVVAGDPELSGVRVERTGPGVALIGEVSSAAAAEQASRLAAALLPEGVPVEAGLRVVLDIGPLRALLAGAPELARVEVQRLARGVALTGDVDSHSAADLALRLAIASLPEGMLVESSLNVRLDLAPLRVLLAGDPELRNVRVKPVGRGVALTGETGSAEASDRAARLATAALPEGIAVENNLRVAPDVEPLRALLAGEPGLERVHVQKLARGVALAGDVASPEAAGRALRLAAASLPEGMLVEDNLTVGLDLAPLRALMAAEAGFEAILVKRIDRGVALTGEVGSEVNSERAGRLAAAALPEGALVENNLRTVLDTGPLRAALGMDPEFDGVRVRALERGVSLVGEVSSAAAADRARRLAAVSLPPDTPVENGLRIGGPMQVNLEVQIAEVQRSIAEDFGFNWELFGRSAEGVLGGGFRIGRQLPPPAAVGGVGRPGTIPPSVVDGLTSPSLVLSQTWEEIGVTGMVDALAKAGLANVLARPNVTANSGETASFFSGGEFPLPSGFKDGVIVFEYKKYGVVLDFVPTIVDEGRIELTVRPEVSEPSRDNSVQVTQGIDVPVINVRRAETTVAMGDGESVVIAGLFSSASNEVQSGVPVLKDLPLVGGMFGHTSTRADELELIVTVTARLVQAGPAPQEAVTAGSGQAVNSYYY